MATIIVNPDASSDGTGSLISPRNVWPSSFSPGDIVLQVAGTRWAGNNGDSRYNILVSQSGTQSAPIICGVCEPQTGLRITDGSQKALVDGTARNISVRSGGGVSWVVFDGFEIFDVTGTGSSRGIGMYLGSSESSIASNCRITNCHIHDIPNSGFGDDNAVQVFGNDCEVSNVLIHDIADDGIWYQGERGLIERNRIFRIGQGPDVTGDGIQCYGNTTLGNSGMIIRYNFVDKTDSEEKQCIILQGHTSNCYGGEIYGNTTIGYKNPSSAIINIYIELLGVSVHSNWVENMYFGILSGLTANGDGSGMRVYGNIVKGSRIGIDQGSSCTGAKIYNNTIVETLDYGIYCDNDTTVEIKNNIVYRCQKGIARENGSTENYNCLYGTVDAANNYQTLGGGAVTIGAQSITTDPLLDASYRPRAGSPCINAGTLIDGVVLKDFYGKDITASPDIGALQVYTARTLRNA